MHANDSDLISPHPQMDGVHTGDHDIDDHHEEIFRLDSLLDAAIRTQDRSRFRDVLTFIDDFLAPHFSGEEGLMARMDYPDVSLHAAEHQKLVERVNWIRASFEDPNAATHQYLSLRRFIDQLIKHIIIVDRRMAEFLKTRAKSA